MINLIILFKTITVGQVHLLASEYNYIGQRRGWLREGDEISENKFCLSTILYILLFIYIHKFLIREFITQISNVFGKVAFDNLSILSMNSNSFFLISLCI